jgi:hypothetical protein
LFSSSCPFTTWLWRSALWFIVIINSLSPYQLIIAEAIKSKVAVIRLYANAVPPMGNLLLLFELLDRLASMTHGVQVVLLYILVHCIDLYRALELSRRNFTHPYDRGARQNKE